MKTYNDKLSFEISFDEYLDWLDEHQSEYTEEDINNMRAADKHRELHGTKCLCINQ